jgi:hypothetical protein
LKENLFLSLEENNELLNQSNVFIYRGTKTERKEKLRKKNKEHRGGYIRKKEAANCQSRE